MCRGNFSGKLLWDFEYSYIIKKFQALCILWVADYRMRNYVLITKMEKGNML